MALDDGWKKDAACRGISDPEVFFPPKYKGIRTDYTAAKRVCAPCRVRRTCLAYAIAHGISQGVWGGMSDTERRALDREMKLMVRQRWWALHPLAKPSRRRKEVKHA